MEVYSEVHVNGNPKKGLRLCAHSQIDKFRKRREMKNVRRRSIEDV